MKIMSTGFYIEIEGYGFYEWLIVKHGWAKQNHLRWRKNYNSFKKRIHRWIRLLVETYTDNPKKLKILEKTLREMCPYTELFLVRIFFYSDWIRRFTSCIQSEYRKIRTRNYSVLDTFQAVGSLWTQRKYAVHPKWTGKKGRWWREENLKKLRWIWRLYMMLCAVWYHSSMCVIWFPN